jgi:hypothetical protein
MGWLDWMKERNRPALPKGSELDPKTHGHEKWKGIYAEIRRDEGLARLRDETGREPECDGLKVKRQPDRGLER